MTVTVLSYKLCLSSGPEDIATVKSNQFKPKRVHNRVAEFEIC